MMKRVSAPYDVKVIENFIEELKKLPLLKDYRINQRNANHFFVKLKDYNNCVNCKGIVDCKNDTIGFYNDVVEEEGKYKNVIKMCRYKLEKKEIQTKSSLIKTLYMPKSILNARLEDYDYHISESRRKAFNYIVHFINNFSRTNFINGLGLIGQFGIGKTFLLSAMANELAKKNVESLIIYFPDMSRELKSALSTPRFDELINMLKDIDVLIIDDLGAEMMTPWLRDEVIGPIINYRVGEKLPIFITSNLNLSELNDHFSTTKDGVDINKAMRIISRLKQVMSFIKMSDETYKPNANNIIRPVNNQSSNSQD